MTAVPIELPDEPGWSTVSVGHIHVLVRAGGALVERVRLAAHDGDLDDVLDALSADGVRATPDFVAVLAGSPLRVVTRGSGYAVASGPAGATELRATGRGPWVDQDAAADVTAVTLHAGAARPQPATPVADTRLPPASEPGSDGGTGWKLPSVFARGRAEEPEPQPASDSGAPATDAAAADEPVTPPAAEVEDLPSYDHLFGATQHDRPSYLEQHDTQGISEPPIGHAPIEAAGGFDPRDSLAEQAPPAHPEHTLAPPRDTIQPGARPAPPAGSPSADPAPLPPPPKTGLIDSVPWRSGGSNVPAPDPAPRPTPVTPPTPTVIPPVIPPAAAPPKPAAEPPVAPAPTSDSGADADATVDRSALLAGRGATVSGPAVLAVLCPAGHTSPPHSGVCRWCGREIPPQQPFQTARPPLGLLRLASGDVVHLDRGVLLGRSPKVNAELAAADRPHLVRVTSAQNDISRNHVEIVLEGWHVLIRDLGSTNGTTVALPGQHPVRLRPSDQQVIEPGTVITLADEVSLTYEVGP
ncbi:FHA domain-containing protein [Phycicoccus sp. Soil802]|uniref:FHA domain-containing protein n=1 Tax=Phycicoccus sp. Soil802 TaxID=1736414 RepID=UPI000712457A|nr:FHA domain-containing protein [Phycicoccus sp. Soil802]KRF28848.1 hypothetical protein ASG91_04195 [Phycicoccus sp. Soil802]